MQGKPIVLGAVSDDETMFIQISESHVGRALRTRRWKYEIAAPDADGWNDMNAASYTEAFLYDLDNDPYELDNRVADPALAGLRAELREKLIGRMVAAGESAPEVVPAT
jgi:arylsulfatase A-like enzyme